REGTGAMTAQPALQRRRWKRWIALGFVLASGCWWLCLPGSDSRFVGTWVFDRNPSIRWTFNANGTGIDDGLFGTKRPIVWSFDGSTLTMRYVHPGLMGALIGRMDQAVELRRWVPGMSRPLEWKFSVVEIGSHRLVMIDQGEKPERSVLRRSG